MSQRGGGGGLCLVFAAEPQGGDRIDLPYGHGSKLMVMYLSLQGLWLLGSHFGVSEFTTHFRTYFSGDWDVHWGYGF